MASSYTLHAHPARTTRLATFIKGAAIVVLGVLALLYVGLAWRAAFLDKKLSLVEEQLQQSRLELWALAQELDRKVAPDAAGRQDQTPNGASPRPIVDTIQCKALPTIQDSVIVDLAPKRVETPVEVPQPRRLAHNPDDR